MVSTNRFDDGVYDPTLLIFKPFRLKDASIVLSWVKSESEMFQWAGPVFTWPLTQAHFHRYLAAAKTKSPVLYPFGLYNGSTILGYCEISNYDRRFNCANASRVIISPKRHNEKLGQYMIGQLLTFGFEQLSLNRIGLGVFDFNTAAIKCYTKVGFALDGTLRQSIKVGESYWNCHIMSVLRDEWRPTESPQHNLAGKKR